LETAAQVPAGDDKVNISVELRGGRSSSNWFFFGNLEKAFGVSWFGLSGTIDYVCGAEAWAKGG
jgi:hypothetical protein